MAIYFICFGGTANNVDKLCLNYSECRLISQDVRRRKNIFALKTFRSGTTAVVMSGMVIFYFHVLPQQMLYDL